MSGRPRRLAESLERHWIARRGGVRLETLDDFDPRLGEVIERLERAAGSEGPSDAFAAQLQERLEAESRAMSAVVDHPARSVAAPGRRGQRGGFGWFGGFGELAATLLVLLLCAGSVVGILTFQGGGDGDDDDDDQGIGGAGATSAATEAAAQAAPTFGTGGAATEIPATGAEPTPTSGGVGTGTGAASPTAAEAEPTATQQAAAGAAAPVEATLIVLPGEASTAIVSGAGGIWVASDQGGLLWRVDAVTNQIVVEIAVADPATNAGAPLALAFGNDSLWVAVPAEGVVKQVDPVTNAVARVIAVDLPAGQGANGVAWSLVIAGDDLWVASTSGGIVRRIDIETGATIADIPIPSPVRLAATGSSLWVAGQDGILSPITRIDIATNAATLMTNIGAETNTATVDGMATADDGVWLASREADPAGAAIAVYALRIDEGAQNMVTSIAWPMELDPGAMFAMSADGDDVWLATTGVVGFVDATRTAIDTILLDDYVPRADLPSSTTCQQVCVGLDVDNEIVWIVHRDSSTLIRLQRLE